MSCSIETTGAKAERSLMFWTDSLLQRSAYACAILPTPLKWAQAADFPSRDIGIPVIAFRKMFSYPQSFPGPVAPASYAARERTAVTARTTAANTLGT